MNAFVQHKNAERQAEVAARIKLAEFRQAWINKLREHFIELQTKLAGKPEQPDEEITKDLFRILLMLNKEDTNVPEIKKLIGKALDPDEGRERAQVSLLAVFQGIIKDEWEVTKSNLNSKLIK